MSTNCNIDNILKDNPIPISSLKKCDMQAHNFQHTDSEMGIMVKTSCFEDLKIENEQYLLIQNFTVSELNWPFCGKKKSETQFIIQRNVFLLEGP